MGKRFGDLEKQALAILANGGNPATSQNKALASYWTWRINPSDSSHNLPTASERPNGRKTNPTYLQPFGVVLPSNVFAKVTISQRSFTAASATVLAACNLHTLVPASETGVKLKSFTPARVYWRTGEATTSAPRISRITKETYKSFYAATDEGYSVPFGRKGTDSLLTRQNEIKAVIGTGINLITFSPEKYRG